MQTFRRVVRASVEATPIQGVLTQLWAVHESLAPQTRLAERPLESLVLVSTEAGGSSLRLEGRRLTFCPEQLVLMPAGWLLPARWLEEPWRLRYLMIAGPWAQLAQERLWRGRALEPIALQPAVHHRAGLGELVDAVLDQRPGWGWKVASGLAQLLGALAEAVAERVDAELFDRVRLMVDAEPERPWSVYELAEALDMSVSSLAHRFREEVGQSPARWVRQRRVAAASRLLEQGLSVTQAAERMGFANPYHFSRAFKQVTGRPPSAVAPRLGSPLDGRAGSGA